MGNTTETSSAALKSNIDTESKNTGQKILKAAQQEFIEKGVESTRMQSIADRAGVNKALLHYYFRSKDKLFKAALQDVISGLWNNIQKEMDSHSKDADLRTLIHSIVSTYITTFAQNPDFPRFFIHELSRNTSDIHVYIREIISSMNTAPRTIFTIYNRELTRGTVKQISVVHFMMNLMGMCAATFIVKPVVELISKDTGNAIVFNDNFYQQRINAITEMACEGIFVKQ